MKNRFDLIIFDWDGTLMDSVDWIVHCLQHAARLHDCPVPDSQAAKDIIGLSIDKATHILFPGVNEITLQKLAQDYSAEFFSKGITAADLFQGVPDLLATLKSNGYQLAVATGKKQSSLRQSMLETGIADWFSVTRSADKTASKPDPLMIDEIVAELGISKHRTLMVGDSIHDMQLAQNAGVASVAVTCGAHSAAVLQTYQPLLCLNYPTELLDFL